MPKLSEKVVPKKASPYKRADAPCTLTLRKKILYRKNEDGTLDESIQTVSNKWYDGTMVCHKSDVERPGIWVIKADVEKGLAHLNEQKSIKYILYSLKDLCQCGNYHRLTKVVHEEVEDPDEGPEPALTQEC